LNNWWLEPSDQEGGPIILPILIAILLHLLSSLR
jgi:hypothetical protein